MEGVEIRHVDVQIAAGKPDAGYAYEGPIEDMPRNISPIVIAGLPDALITDIRLDSITVSYPGGANPFFARVGLNDLDKVPERPDAYPDFSMFRELPAWGIYIRHARDIRISGLNISCRQKDYRTAVVLDDVHETTFKAVRIREPEKKNKFYIYRSSGVVTP
jgi:hypothetical protein